MKKRLFFFSFLAISIFSCSSNDDPPGDSTIPETQKYLGSITDAEGVVKMSFEYNEAKNVERINYQDVGLITYGYESGKIVSMNVYFGGEDKYTFTYDAYGRMNSYTIDDIVTPIIYNSTLNFYLYAKENGDEESIHFDADGDATKFVSYDDSENSMESTIMLYDNQKKGSFTNTSNVLLATCMANSGFETLYIIYNLSKKPVRTVTLFGMVVDFQNTYDSQDFIKSSSRIENGQTITTNYNYVKL